MKILCDVCERNPATVICCADEAALCAKCDVDVHAANKLASKHQRLLLHCLSNKLPTCDICQDKAAFIFCVEDRALFCQDCDESVHQISALSANHQRYLATGIKVALAGSNCASKVSDHSRGDPPPKQNASKVGMKQLQPAAKQQQPSSALSSPSWAVEDLLEFSELVSTEKEAGFDIGELDWWSDMSLFGDQLHQEALAAAEVPEVPTMSQLNHGTQYKTNKSSSFPYKKPRVEVPDDDEDYLIVPDLG